MNEEGTQENTVEFPVEETEPETPETPQTFTLDDVKNMVASEREKWEADVQTRFGRREEPEVPEVQDDLQTLMFNDPAKFAQMVEERAYNRAMQQLAPQVSNMSRRQIESELLAEIPEAARDAARAIIKDIPAQELLHINDVGMKAIRRMAIGEAYESGTLVPQAIQQGGRGSGRGDVINLVGGYTKDDIEGYNRMLEGKKTLSAKELRDGGYGR